MSNLVHMLSFLTKLLEIERKRLNYNENLKFMPFGKSFHFYAIWELCHLGSYQKIEYTSVVNQFTISNMQLYNNKFSS